MRLLTALVVVLAATASSGAEETSCVACHGNEELMGEEQAGIVAAFETGAHRAAELSCHDCHGGDPDPSLAEDMAGAMDPDHPGNPYRGAPGPSEVPGFCGRCHSDPEFMRRYVPDPRVDQEREYWTSQHGRRLGEGNTSVATCVDCHGAHGILGPGATRSPVYPTRVAETCRGCHADPGYMAGAADDDGPLPVDQYARWRQSVHAVGLLEHEDLSAPTCNDCHGNHGAVPPGVESIGFVCGQCHGREAELFRSSGKRAGFAEHAGFVEGTGEDPACDVCHGEDQPQTGLEREVSFAECTACHGNHGIVAPTLAMLSPLPETPCDICHVGVTDVAEDEGAGREIRRHFSRVRDELLQQAEAEGLVGEERFNWLVERTRELRHHSHGDGETDGEPRWGKEFERLYEKFRIGTTFYEYRDPVSGETVRAPVPRCGSCHAEEPDLAQSGRGLATSRRFEERMLELTTRTARAERLLLAARRGGVETRRVADEIDQAVEAQIELAVLVHTFSAEEDGEFESTAETGLEHAREAIHLADEALGELSFRRTGLAISLGVIVLVLIALALKIRQLS